MIALPLDTIQQMGGLDKIMAEHGIRSIWVNEFDLSAIHGKRLDVESRGVTPQSLDEIEGDVAADLTMEQQQAPAEDLPPEQQLQMLLGRLSTTTDDDIYAMLVRQAISCSDVLKSRHELLAIFPLLELLASHCEDELRSPKMREFDRFAIEQTITGDLFLRFIFNHVEQPGSLTKNALQEVLNAGGSPAIVLAVEKMGTTENLATRKMLAIMLSRLGETAVPTLLEITNDKRWYIVRNICVILGVIASGDAVHGLVKCLRHTDTRVCKEAVRALAKTGGREAEAAIIDILRGNDTDLYPQAVSSLGAMKSRKALNELMRILTSKDMFLKSLSLKLDVLAAIAMIGDRKDVPRLVELLAERHLLAGDRWKQLKSAVAQCLGKLGDVRALPTLKEYASRPGEPGSACAEAVELIEKSGGKPDGRT